MHETPRYNLDKEAGREHDDKVLRYMQLNSAAHGRGSVFRLSQNAEVRFTEKQLMDFLKATGQANIAAEALAQSVTSILADKARTNAIMDAAEESMDSEGAEVLFDRSADDSIELPVAEAESTSEDKISVS